MRKFSRSPFVSRWFSILSIVTVAALCGASAARAETAHAKRFEEAVEVLNAFTQDEAGGIPIDLLARAQGIAVIPDVIRGGFLIGGRRGRGVLTVRGADGRFTNPVLVTLTGGSIGGQIGVASADLVLVFANERSVRNIQSGKFTLGGDASAVAGPSGRHTAVALTANAEVYMYVRSRGLFAGAAFEGARLDVDEEGTALFYYAANSTAPAFGPASDATPAPARTFLAALERAAAAPRRPAPSTTQTPTQTTDTEEARTFPLER
ncbi:MAG TPA: lipid-binding SYLF domain-containing protein [Gammaproteobacteria bacterium]